MSKTKSKPPTTWKDTVENPEWVKKRLKMLATIRNDKKK